jgi:UPF0755 protein
MARKLIAGTFFCVCVFGLAGWVFCRFLTTPSPAFSYPVHVFIPERTTLRATARLLADEKLISDWRLFLLWARVTKADRKIQSGEYEFATAISPLELLRILTRGESLRISVTVIEGMTFKQLATLLRVKGLGTEEQFLCLNEDPQFLTFWGLPPEGIEGYIYPATYQFSRRATPEDILGQMIAHFYMAISPAMYRKTASLGLSVHQIITLATLIEKETGATVEKNLVSAVFHNRLRQGMPLQCDSSVIYGIPTFDGNLTRQHLLMPSPYNTYLLRGLPPGPIANPSTESVLAALNPLPSDYLYFVAKGDGTHEFSVDLTSHNRAVRRFQKGHS